ncbi:filamin-A-like isoform X3 [Ptychodera flava]|uniref:filamin-A-like isoform X3 n=1 Tax=Ptychodera flava TaxID=63121 RepID=UPI003969E848
MVIESDFATVEEPAVFEAGMVIEEEPSVNVVDKDDFNVDVKVVEDGESPSEMTSTRVSFVKRGLTSIGGRFSSMISRDKGSVQDQTQESTAEEPADIVLETDAANIQEAEIATDVNENERTSKTVTIVKRGFTKFGEKFQSMMKKDTSEIREQEELITVTEQPSIESAIEVDLQPEQSVVTVESDTAVVEETDVLETDTVIEEVPSGMIVEKEETISVEDGEITDGTSSRVSFVKRGLTTIGGKFQIMMSRDKKSNDDQVEEIAVVEEPPEIVLEKATINVQETENTLDVNASEETFTTVTMVKRGFTRFGEKFQSLMTKDTAEIEDKKEVITVVEEPRIESGIEVNIHAEPSVSTIESEMAMVEESDVLETDVVVEEPVEINIEKENFSVPELETQDTPSSPVTVIKSGFSKFGERFQSIITKGTTKTQTEEEVINVTEQPRFESGIEVNVQPEQSVTIVESDIVMVEEPDMLETEIVIEEEPSESIVEKDSVSVQESEVSDETSSKVSFVQRGLTTLGGKFQIMMSRDKGKKEDHVEEITAVEEPADTVLEKDDVDVQETEVSNDANASDVTSRTVTVVKRGLTEFKEKFQSMMTKETVTVVEEEDKEEVASFSVQPTIESGIEVNIEPEQSVTIVESDIVMVEEPDMLETEIVIEEEPSESIVEKDSVSVQESEVSDETSSKVSFVQRGLTTIGGKFQIMMSRDKGKKEAHVEEITAVEEPADTVLEKDDVDVHIEETEAGESVNTTTVTSRTVTVVKRGFTRFGEKFQSLMTKDTAGIEGEEEVISVSEEPRIESGIELNIQPEQSVSIVEGEFTLVEEPVAMETETLIEAEPSETTVEKDSISFQESEVSDETSSKVSFMQRGLTTIEERFHAMMSRNKDSRENQAEDITVTVVDEPTEIVLEKDTVNIQETEVTNDVNARTSSKVTIVKRGITKLEETFHSLIGKSATPAGQVQEEVIVAQGEPIIERTILTYSEPEDEDETDFTEKRTFKVSFSRNISAEEEEYWKVIEGDTISIDGMKSDVLVQEEDIVPSVRDYSEPTFAEPMAEYLNSTEMDHSFEMIQEDMVPVFNPKKAYVTGRGIQPKGIRVREDAIFYVHTKEAGEAELRVQIIGPGGINEPAQIVSNKDGTYTVKYRPLKPGRYIINVTYGKEHVMKSPFTVNISPEAEPPLTYVKAYGPGLESGCVGSPCNFTVETNGAVGALGFSIEGPSEAEIKCVDNGDGSCEVAYFPTAPGEYAIHITCDDEDIVHSPYMAQISPNPGGFDASKVKAYGKGVEKNGPKLGQPVDFIIDTKAAGKAPVKVTVTDQYSNEVPVDVKDNGDGTFKCTYTAPRPVKHSVSVTYGSIAIPNSPFRVEIEGGADKVKVYGPGIEPNKVVSTETTYFTIDVKEAGGPGPIHVAVKSAPGVNGKGEKEIKSTVKDNGDGTYKVQYTPENPGKYAIAIGYHGKPVPQSPIYLDVQPKIDLSKVYVDGLETTVTMQKVVEFDVITSGAGEAPLKVTILSPTGKPVEVVTEETVDGYGVSFTPTEEGEYTIEITFGGKPIKDSPFKTNAVPGADPSKCRAHGPGLKGGHINKPATFTIETGDAGTGALGLTVEGPSEAKIDCKDNGDGSCSVSYVPDQIGEYNINITFAEQHIPGSPFPAKVFDASKVVAKGPGLEPGVRAGEPADIEVDCTKAGEAPVEKGEKPVTCAVRSPTGKPVECDVDDNKDGTFDVCYYPKEPGPHTVDLKYGGYDVPKGKQKIPVQPAIKTDAVKVFGPGVEPKGVFLDSPTDFTVDAKPIGGLPKDALKCAVTNPAGQVTEPLIKDNKDGTYNVSYTPTEEGPHKVDVKVAGKPIGKSPYNVGVVEGSDATKCKAYGPGLEGGNTNKPCKFTVETKGAGTGGLGLAIEGPSEAKMTCVDNKDGTCSVEYWPTKPGDYEVQIKFADQHIPGSPFHAAVKDVVDHTKVKASGPGLERAGVRAGAPATFTVDATKAGVAPLDVTVIPEKGPKEKPLIKDNGDGTFECTYMPQTEGKCDVEVKYADKQIPQSPFHTKILPSHDASKVKVQGPGLEKTGIPASLPIEFIVDTRDAGDAELTITITDANGKHIKPDIIDNGDGTYRIRYTPTDVGRYTITVKYGGDQVPYSPYHVRTSPTGDASKVEIIGVKCGDVDIPIVRRMSTDTEGSVSSYASTSTTTTTTTTTRETITKTVTVHEETVIKVNSRDAGKGRVTATVTAPDGTDVGDVKVIDNGDGTFDIVWTCPATGRYTLDIKFGGVAITGGPFKVVAEEGPPRTDIDSMSQDMRPFDLVIPVTGAGTGKITGEVKTPSGKRHKPQITENKDGTIKVKYSPTEKGLHILYIKYNDKDVPGSPFEFHVVEVKSGQVTAYGPGLTHGVVCEPCNFTINTKDAGAGGLALAVEGPSKAEIKCIDNKDGTCSVSYYPTKPGDYSVIVKFADKHVPGSPFNAKITDGPMRHLPLGRSSEVPLRINETDLSQLTATIKSPSSTKDEPCQLKRLPNGNIGISFTPKETGDHMVSVKKRGLHVTNSPFKVTVGPQEIGDASKVKVSGLGIAEADAGEIAEFLVDTTKAGYGGLGVSIEGPSKADINCEDNGDGTCTVTYRPTEPGNYILNVKYADQHVPGSPFKVKVHGEGSGKFVETITRKRQAAAVSQVGSECELGMKIPGTDPLDMTAQVTNPAGKTEDAEIVDGSAFTYTVRFVPNMMGVHTVSVKHKGMHVAGSPFQFTVGPLGEGGAHKVHAGGPGLERGEVKQKSEFTVWTREAGPGSLSISVEGPAKAEIDFEDKKDGSCQVCYEPTEPGEYAVSIKYNDEHIPDSPYKVFVTPPIGDARRLSVTSLQETGLKPNQPASFAVQLNGAQGLIDAKVVAPSGTEDDCIITEISEGNYAVRFMPRENGVHMIHVRFKGAHIPGSPFRVRVGSVEGDPGMVHATGPGLESARTGEKTHFIVNTCGAGAGAMAITIDGPSKVKMDVEEVPEGYKCMYTPMAPGDYFITIKYAGAHHIVGSPFKVKVTGANKAGVTGVHESSQMVVETVTKTTTTTNYASMPTFTSDASKVTSTGMGLKKAFINRKAQFTVNASDAGNNMLTVGIAGPKTPCEEILVKHNGRNRYIINYILKEKGNYVMIVKWGNDHIPGSPFQLVCS